MKCSIVRRAIAALLVFCQISLSGVMLIGTDAIAQTLDTEPPVVTFETIDEARKGDSQVFTVTATDNVRVESVTIFYRMSPDEIYAKADMSRIGQSDLHTFTIPSSSIPDFSDVVQYYIEAKDAQGNRTLEGFSFDPLERLLVDTVSASANSGAQSETGSSSLLGSLSTTQKVLFGALGVVVVGALISAANSGGDDESSAAPGVPVTVIVDPLVRFR